MSATDSHPTETWLPVPYDPSVEVVSDDEDETIDELVDTMRKISETTYQHSHHAIRSVHAKSHGMIEAELTVIDGLPPELAQGLFATPGSYPVVMRYSTIPGDILDDNVSTPRGLAIKVIGVAGARLPGSEAETTQDFVLVNGPTFATPDAAGFLRISKLLAATTDRGPGLKKALSTALQGVEEVVEKLGGKSGTLIALGGHPETNVLGETYYSQAPLLFGAYIAKLSVVPVSPELAALTGARVDLEGKPNGLREATIEFFRDHGGVWELRAQLCVDLDSMPIEDATVEWPEEESPYVAVARIVAQPQVAWSEERATVVDDRLAFSPWNGLAAHRPLGSVMRARKRAYEMSRQFRAEHNHVAIDEPASELHLPG